MVRGRAPNSGREAAPASAIWAFARVVDEYISATNGGTVPVALSDPTPSRVRLSEGEAGVVVTTVSLGGAMPRSGPRTPLSSEIGDALLSVFSIAGLVATISLVPPDTTAFAITRIGLAWLGIALEPDRTAIAAAASSLSSIPSRGNNAPDVSVMRQSVRWIAYRRRGRAGMLR